MRVWHAYASASLHAPVFLSSSDSWPFPRTLSQSTRLTQVSARAKWGAARRIGPPIAKQPASWGDPRRDARSIKAIDNK